MEILLAKMNRSYLDYKDTNDFLYDGFSQALDNLKEDIMLFSAENGIDIIVTATDIADPTFERVTAVIGELNETDYGILKMMGITKHTATNIALQDNNQYTFVDWVEVEQIDLVRKLKKAINQPIKC